MLILSEEKYNLNTYRYVYSRRELTQSTGDHQHLYYEFMFVYSGVLVHAVNGVTRYMEPNMLTLIRPGDSHSIGAMNFKEFKFFNVMISLQEMEAIFDFFGKELRETIETLQFPPVILFSPPEGELFLKNLESVSSKPPHILGFKFTSRLLFSQILYKLTVSESFDAKPAFPQWFYSLLNKMQMKENFAQGLPALVRLSNKSHEYLCRSFKRYLAITPVVFINDTRLKYAQNMLRTTDLPVMDIMLDAGFNNISHFNHIFKERFGCAPLTYRNLSRTSEIDSSVDGTDSLPREPL